MARTSPTENIERSILLIRGHKVLIDVHLAALYGVTTKQLNEQVRRNRARFPEDFMFQLTTEEVASLRSQFATSNKLVALPRTFFTRRVAMTAAEKKLVDRNLDLIFEFEKYVLEHPAIAAKIPRDAVVFMKVAGDPKFNRWSERQAKKQATKGAPLISITVKKMGPVHSRIAGLALEHAA